MQNNPSQDNLQLKVQDELLDFLLEDEYSRFNFNEILIKNKNNVQFSLMLMRRWLRENTDRGRIELDTLEIAFKDSSNTKLRLALGELFLDIVSEDMCLATKQILVDKNITCAIFHETHLNNVDKPLQRLLSSL